MKNTKKILLGLGAAAAVATPIVATVSCSLFGGKSGDKSSRQFYNYEDYIDGDIQSQIEGAYTYSQFGDLPEFKQAIIDGTAAAGIGSDYFNAMLADQGLIQKIDFGRLYGITNDRSQWATVLEKYYTPEAWKLLTAIELVKRDSKGKIVLDDKGKEVRDIDGDGADDFLWEYMAPYFMQNKVVAVNVKDIEPGLTGAHIADVSKMTNAEFEALFTDKSYSGIFTKLKELGVKNFTVNDYMRDNMMIGSEKIGSFTSTVKDYNEGKAQIDAFMNTIKPNFNNVTWKTSGVETLESITNKADNADHTSQAALMYNGDALAAFNGGYEDGGVSGQIRVIVPENPTFMLDGFVISSDIKNDRVEMNRIYDVAQNILYKGVNTSYLDEKGANPFAAFKSENNVFKNFDYVGYTAAFNQLYKYIDTGTNYFDNNDAKAIFEATAHGAAKIDKNHITTPIIDDLTIQLGTYYDSQK